MRHITALIIAITILAGAQAAQAEGGKVVGTLAGATIGSLTFKNKVSGAAIGAGVGLLVGAVVDSEMDRHSRRQVVREVRHDRRREVRHDRRREVRHDRRGHRGPERVVTIIKERPRRHHARRGNQYRKHRRHDRHPVRERRVVTRMPNGRVKVVETTIYR